MNMLEDKNPWKQFDREKPREEKEYLVIDDEGDLNIFRWVNGKFPLNVNEWMEIPQTTSQRELKELKDAFINQQRVCEPDEFVVRQRKLLELLAKHIIKNEK